MVIEKEEELPLVSVIVPCYNHERYITDCIESIVNQTYKNIELTVIDDGSKDSSLQILTNLQIKYGFNLVFQENHGIAYTINRGIKEYSHGKYITICASDDYWTKDKTQRQVNFMISHPEYPMCYSKCFYIDEDSNIITNKKLYKSEKKFKGGNIFKDLLLVNFHPPVSYMYTKEILEEINYFTDGVICEDFYMNLKIGNKYQIGYLDDRLIYYRFMLKSEQRLDIIVESQKDIISQYADSEFYKKAINKWKLRTLATYSGNIKFRNKYLKLLLDMKFSFNIIFWKSLFRVLINVLSHK